MTRKKSERKVERKRFSPEFKQQALLRSAKDGIPAVARDLGELALRKGAGHMAYGYRDDAYFFLKIRAAFPGVGR